MVGGVGMYGLAQGSRRLYPARPMARAVFKAGPGRGGSHKEEMKGLASKPQGKGRGGYGQEPAQVGPLQHPQQTRPSCSSEAVGSAGSVSAKHKDISQARIQSQSPCPVPQQLWTWGWVSMGTGHLQLSDSSDSWGGKESHSPGNGSPRWCLQGPLGPSAGPW